CGRRAGRGSGIRGGTEGRLVAGSRRLPVRNHRGRGGQGDSFGSRVGDGIDGRGCGIGNGWERWGGGRLCRKLVFGRGGMGGRLLKGGRGDRRRKRIRRGGGVGGGHGT